MRLLLRYIPCLIMLLALAAGCSRGRATSPALEHIDSLASANPQASLAALDSIDRASLTSSERTFYDLLRIKTRDKAYINHTSDSLILSVIERLRGSDPYHRLPEALYYGGRVYSDLGDFPTALDYFHRALDALPDSTKQLELRSCILSQTGRLLNRLRLYQRAIPYLRQTLATDSVLSDTFNLAFDHQLLGSIYLHLNDFDNADINFDKAISWSSSLADCDKAHMEIYLAASSLKQNDIAMALEIIKDIPDRIDSIGLNLAMATAANIYMAAEIPDTAFMYVDRLIHSSDDNNKKNGFTKIFSPQLRQLIPDDSVETYIFRYADLLDDYYNKHDIEQTLIQNSLYNYQIHDRQRAQAERKLSHFTIYSLLALIVILLCLLCIVLLYLKKKTIKNKLHTALLELNALQNELRQSQLTDRGHDQISASEIFDEKVLDIDLNNVEHLKMFLRESIKSISSKNSQFLNLEEPIANSWSYNELKQLVSIHSPVRLKEEEEGIWTDLENAILSCSPNFKRRIRLLLGDNIKSLQYHTVLLIRCGFTPTQTQILLGRQKGTISYHRRKLCSQLLGEEFDNNLIDNVIRIL